MRLPAFIFLLLTCLATTFAQKTQSNSHPFSNSWVISGEGGITLSGTDFPDSKIDYFGRGSFEYFFRTNSSNAFGIRLFAGGGYLAGKGLVSSDPEYVSINEFRTKIVYGGLGLTYSLSLGKVVHPYLFAGASYFIFDPFKSDGTKMPRNAAAEYATDEIDYMGEFGIRFMLSKKFSINVGYTLNYLQNDNLDDIWRGENDAFHSIFGGLSFYISPSADSDQDGIKDSKDLCENTPIGVQVDEFGCPLDSDLDKVPDYLDLCNNTPAGIEVDSSGCPIDSDSDGIPDYRDQCPNTKANVAVDEKGCEKIILKAPEPKLKKEIGEEKSDSLIFVLSGSANFEIGKAELLPNPKSGLDKLITIIKDHPETRWVIEGHTDNLGSDNDNYKLSTQRANSVLNYFIQNGLDKNRFETIGAGSSKPAADNSVEFGRAINRRVVIEEKESYERKKKMMDTFKSVDYDYSKEYNIEGLIFTDSKYYCIQVSSWKNRDIAAKEVERLRTAGHPAYYILTEVGEAKEKWFRVRIGFFNNLDGTRSYMSRVR